MNKIAMIIMAIPAIVMAWPFISKWLLTKKANRHILEWTEYQPTTFAEQIGAQATYRRATPEEEVEIRQKIEGVRRLVETPAANKWRH